MLAAGAFGLFNGWLVTRLRIQPIIATLVLFIAGRGIAQVLTNGNLQVFKNPEFQFIGLGRLFGIIPFQAVLMVVVVAAAAWMLTCSGAPHDRRHRPAAQPSPTRALRRP